MQISHRLRKVPVVLVVESLLCLCYVPREPFSLFAEQPSQDMDMDNDLQQALAMSMQVRQLPLCSFSISLSDVLHT